MSHEMIDNQQAQSHAVKNVLLVNQLLYRQSDALMAPSP